MNASMFGRHLRRVVAFTLAAALLPLSALAATGKVNCSSLVMRKSASRSSKILCSLDKNDRLNVISASGDWYKVSHGKYTGYVMKQYVNVSGTIAQASNASDSGMNNINSIADIGSAPATSRPGDKGINVKKLQQALKLKGYYTGKIDSSYGNGTKEAVQKFQKANKLSRDGIAGPVTIKTLFGTNASNVSSTAYKTQRLDWFNGGSNVIPKGATFTVKDVKTGKTFTCKRWSGAKHMDVEPLTAKDAQIMKSIYGGKWSWNRRAVLVKYNDQVYAGSMNGMPHGEQTIKNNGFDGHFCIHFYKSRTHGTNKVDTAHQNAVATAMKAVW